MDCVWILGTRGSAPVSGPDFARWGGATTCMLLRLGGQFAVLDAGSGLLQLPEEALRAPELPLLLTHLHLDHLTGLPMCPYLMHRGGHMPIYCATHAGKTAETALSALYRAPFWPVPLTALASPVSFHPMEERFELGAICVETMRGVHPDGITLLRLSAGGKRVVFATDCTLTEELKPLLRAFAADCDLLLVDGQYSDKEWEKRAHFGHSAWTAAAALGRDCGAKKLRVIHHDPGRDDAAMDAADEEIRRIFPAGGAAREGEVIAL